MPQTSSAAVPRARGRVKSSTRSEQVSSSLGARDSGHEGGDQGQRARTVALDVQLEVPAGRRFAQKSLDVIRKGLFGHMHNAERHGAPPVRIEVRSTGEQVEIAVVDSGAGVAPAVLGSIFEPFVGATERGGLGLGLGLSRGLAEAQGGRLRLDPTTGGARFVLSLPIDEWHDA